MNEYRTTVWILQ